MKMPPILDAEIHPQLERTKPALWRFLTPLSLKTQYLPMESTEFGREAWWTRFRELLDGDQDWPSRYLFKFIVPSSGLDELRGVFGGHPVSVRTSSGGRYVSVTARMEMQSSDEVIEIYRAAGQIEGVISL